MKLDVIKLDGAKAGSVDLDEALFGLEPRVDILHRVVRWQRNNAQAGTPQGENTVGSKLLQPRKFIVRKGPAAHVTVLALLRFSAVAVFTRVQLLAAMGMNYPRKCVRWV